MSHVLQKVDRISVTLLMDNYTDRLLPSVEHAARAPMAKNERILPAPVAEHGFSAMVDVYRGGRKWRFLFDTGVSKDGVVSNASLFGVGFDIEAIILSHGHFDHTTGLASILESLGRPTRLIAHPDAFKKRWIIFPDGTRALMPSMDQEELGKLGAVIEKTSASSALPSSDDACILVTGEIPRKTPFEIGFPLQYEETTEGLVHDPLVRDDQALVANLKGKGLVVISGCGHAGIINTMHYAKELAGVDRLYAVVGGFHLTGPTYEKAIEPTLDAMAGFDLHHIVPCHCTGWKAVNRIIQLFPEKFIQPSVGTTLDFYSD
jgi:7,8-dihydropterin-6-yl-methyl-4-(beta-D-ribofuranosyl)aminobenzene 5'-phosphate synthase